MVGSFLFAVEGGPDADGADQHDDNAWNNDSEACCQQTGKGYDGKEQCNNDLCKSWDNCLPFVICRVQYQLD